MQAEITLPSLDRAPQISLAGKRILICADLYGLGGTENHLVNLCELLTSEGAQVTLTSLVVRNAEPLLRRLRGYGVRHISTPFASRQGLLRASQMWAYSFWWAGLRRDFDVLYTYGVGRFTAFMKTFVVRGGSIVWHPFGDPKHLPGIIAQMPRGILTVIVTESAVHQAVVNRSTDGGIPTRVLAALTNTRRVAPIRANSVQETRVAFLGRFDQNKGALWLARRWPTLRISAAHLDFVGDGPDRRELESIAALSGGQIAVREGWTSAEQLANILDATDLVVLPSLSEGIPLTLLECMASGVPFVASDVGGIPSLAEGNPDVRIAPRGEQFERAIEEMVFAIRRGEIDRARLQRFYGIRYAPAKVQASWRDFFGNC